MMNTVCQLVILFFIFACLGWVMEVVLKFIQYHRFINRGFLIGPYCPIYGWGVVAVTVLVGGMIGREGTISEIFWAGVVLCGALEYFTSWFMEVKFHARWWDYSHKPMNLHGRIWIGNLLLFGAGSVIIMCFIDPVFWKMIEKLHPFWLHVSAISIIVLMLADHAATYVLMEMVRKEIDAQDGDNTEEISIRVRALLKNKNMLFRRLEQAFPDLHTHPHWLTLQIQQAKKDYKEAKRHAEKLLRQSRKRIEDHVLPKHLEAALETEKRALKKLRELQKKQIWHHDD